jgi:integrase
MIETRRRAVPTVSRTLKLTKPAVERAWRERSSERRTVVRDMGTPGLLLIVNAKSAGWAYEYKPRGKDERGRRYGTRQLGLGDLAAVDLEAARALAVQAKAAVGRGEDPARANRIEVARQVEERRRDRTTSEVVGDYCGWIDRQPRSAKHRTDEKRQVRRAIELAEVGGLPLGEIRRAHLVQVLDAATGPALPRKLLGSFGRFLSWAADRELIPFNPALLIDRRRKPRPPTPRSRVLSLAEMGKLWNAAPATQPARGKAAEPASWSRLIRFALLVPARTKELRLMDWGQVDLDGGVWTQPHLITKNGDPFTVPLPDAAVALLREQKAAAAEERTRPGDPVWIGPSQGRCFNAWAGLVLRLRKTSHVAGWSWHDLRRTVVSHLAEHGVAESVADSLLNHRQSATRGGVLGVYQRSRRQREREAALALWAELVEQAAAADSSENVVRLTTRAV